MTEENQTPWKISYKENNPFTGTKINIQCEGPDKAGVEELLKTVKKEMVK